MKKLVSLFLTLCVLLSLALPALGESIPATFLYVATDGNDTAAGTIEAPFQTLQAAINASRAIDGTVVINMRGGTYQVTETITLTEEDHDLVIRAYQEEDVILTGSTALSLADFKPCEDAAFLDALVDQSVRESIVCANLLELGVTEMGEMRPNGPYVYDNKGYAPTLSFNEKSLTLARYPNEGYAYTKDIIRSGRDEADALESSNQGMISYTISDKDERLAKWSWEDVWNLGFFAYDWANTFTPAQYDAETGTVLSSTIATWGVLSNRRVCFINVPEEMDIPGEWYLDRETGLLYLIPTDDMTADSQLVFNSFAQDLVSANGVKNVSFIGLKLLGTTETGVNAEGCDGLVLDDCEISVIGRMAVHFTDCWRSGLQNSYLHDLSATGILLDDCGDRITLTSGECFITNCRFERFTQDEKAYAPAICLESTVGTLINHCEFSDAPHSAILTDWSAANNDMTIEYCEFYDICNDTGDCGVIYLGRRWDARGNVIRYNYFHDMLPSDTPADSNRDMVYLDDLFSSANIYANVFYNTTTPLRLGGGRSNSFTNNLMLDCWSRIATDDRGVTWNKEKSPFIDPESSRYLGKFLQEMPYQEGIWAEKYPELVNILEDKPLFPKYNTIANNITYTSSYLDSATISTGVKMFGTVKNNYDITSTDGFVDYENRDFTLKEDSEVFTLIPDFEPIPFNEIGLYEYTVEDVYVEAQ